MSEYSPLFAVLGILFGLFVMYLYIKRRNKKQVQEAMDKLEKEIEEVNTHMSEGDDQPNKVEDTRKGGNGGLSSPASIPNIPKYENQEVPING